ESHIAVSRKVGVSPAYSSAIRTQPGRDRSTRVTVNVEAAASAAPSASAAMRSVHFPAISATFAGEAISGPAESQDARRRGVLDVIRVLFRGAMRAAVMRDARLVVDDVPDPVPGAGEVLVKTLACGICGSDLHALQHAPKLVEAAHESGLPFVMDP